MTDRVHFTLNGHEFSLPKKMEKTRAWQTRGGIWWRAVAIRDANDKLLGWQPQLSGRDVPMGRVWRDPPETLEWSDVGGLQSNMLDAVGVAQTEAKKLG